MARWASGTDGVCLRRRELGKDGTVSLYVDSKKVCQGKVAVTMPTIFSDDDGCDIGKDMGAPVAEDYGPRGNKFSGRVRGVQIAIAEAAASENHRVSPKEPLKVLVARRLGLNSRLNIATLRTSLLAHAPNSTKANQG
jgi:hypothetical protein